MSFFGTLYKSIINKDTSGPWKKFAEQHQGEYRYEFGDKVIFFHNDFKVIFNICAYSTIAGSTSYEREYFRAIVEFISPDNLQLKILLQDLIESIGKVFGSQDIEIGDPSFDPEFMIKGNDPAKTRIILSDKSTREMLLEQRDEMLRLEVTSDYGLFGEKAPDGQSMLYFVSKEKISHSKQLDRFRLLIINFLDQLEKTNSAKPAK